MKQREIVLLAVPPNWKPETMAIQIEKEVASWWDKGWVFVKADTDQLMESVLLHFERDLTPD
jgi:hypothetical protein